MRAPQANAGRLRIPATPGLAYDFRTWRRAGSSTTGVEVNGLRHSGSALDPFRNARSPYGGRWPVGGQVADPGQPDDVRQVWFQDPDRPDPSAIFDLQTEGESVTKR